MKYNFDEVIDRSGNRAGKYDERMKKFGTMDVIPLWVADMDFRTAQPVIDACVETVSYTHLGNAPNFMVKSISDENGIRMPSFFGYLLWSLAFLVPVFVLDMLIFFL